MISGGGAAAAWCLLHLTERPLLLFPGRKSLAASLRLPFSSAFLKYHLKPQKWAQRGSASPEARASRHVPELSHESSDLGRQPCMLGSPGSLGFSPRSCSCFQSTLFKSRINLSQLLSQHMLANRRISNQFHMSKDFKIRSLPAAAVWSCEGNKWS